MYHLPPKNFPYNGVVTNIVRGEFKVIEMVQHNYIRFLFFNKGKSKRAIAKELGIHRNTVTRAIANLEPKYNLTVEQEKPVNGPFTEKIKLMIQKNYEKGGKERLTKTRMHELLQDEGYTGSYSAFTYQARQIEEELQLISKEAFLKLLPRKGSLQVDFGEMIVLHQGKKKKVYAFCAKLCFSKVEFIQIYPSQKTEYFLEGLMACFAFFGAVPKIIIFDNLKPAVKTILTGTERELQERFLKFQSFYCFEAEFCGPGKGNEKGMVENLVKYTRNNYFLPFPNFTDFDTFNAELISKCQQRMKKGTFEGQPWVKLLLEEDFLPFTEFYDCARILEATVNTYQLIHVERNRYSVPTQYVGKKVQIRMYPFKVVVTYKEKVIAEHNRLFGRDNEILNPYHYLTLLQRKARAFDQAKVIHDWRLPPIYETYHRRLQAHRQSKAKGTRELIDILRLTEEHGVSTIAKILKELDEKNQYSYAEVLSLLRYQKDCTTGTRRLAEDELTKYHIENYTVTHLNLKAYDELTGRGA